MSDEYRTQITRYLMLLTYLINLAVSTSYQDERNICRQSTILLNVIGKHADYILSSITNPAQRHTEKDMYICASVAASFIERCLQTFKQKVE